MSPTFTSFAERKHNSWYSFKFIDVCQGEVLCYLETVKVLIFAERKYTNYKKSDYQVM